MAFMRYKTTGYQWAVTYPAGEWKVLFGRGSDGVLISEQGVVSSGQLTSFHSGFAARSAPYRQSSDGAFMLPVSVGSWLTLFFRGDRSERLHWDRGVQREGAWTEEHNWGSALPAGFRSQIDALLQAPNAADGNWQTYFFKGPRVLTLHWITGVVRDALITEGPDASGCAGWASLPEEFRSDLDHVIAYKNAADGTRQSLLVKGAKGLLLNWKTGVLASGELHQLGVPGLAALPAEYRTPLRPVTGRYTGASGSDRVELRVDLEGERSLATISGDFFTNGVCVNSFRTGAALSVDQTANAYTLAQTGLEWSSDTWVTRLALTIPRVAATANAANAALVLDAPGNNRVLQFDCSYASTGLRTVELETDSVVGTQVFQRYDTAQGWNPPGYRNRTLTVTSAYAEAGIEIRDAGNANTITADTAGADLAWSDAELHAAMTASSSVYQDVPQWRFWAFVATRYTKPTVAGVMFDYLGGVQRQGMAVFHQSMQGFGWIGNANELFCYVHEIGHGFNLAHSWQKHLAQPPAPLGPDQGYGDLSWMNYPQNYSQGEEAYWRNFRFQFTDNELRHLRHGFYQHIIPGGSSGWMVNSALEDSALAAAETSFRPSDNPSGLTLTLGGKQVFGYGEPVMAEVRLALAGERDGITVTESIGPKGERTVIAITDPQGRTRLFRPLARTCTGHGGGESAVTLNAERPAVYETVYLGYGADGLYFAEPGLYKVTAVHTGLDGARTVSPTRTLRVRLPLDRTDQNVGELLTGDDQGALLALLGSDTPSLASGNDALQELIDRYGDHPLAAYARLARGANAGRHFQTVTDGRLQVRQPDTETAVTQLTDAIDASRTDQNTGLDNLTLNAAMRRLATVHAKAGDLDRADAVLTDLTTHFREQGIPAHVQEHIQQQADETRAAITEQTGDRS
ncbi:hypothetical protein GCM10010387_50490 [Streptomyces inusitatus]|uniref:Uncharacterized protein n=1 Tax=Streptomyces inusitatus TaxID=68221 RepID=A0A918QJI4_9ACTN|nr:hypothetical protein [Streptomyces inusitatus]GGZ50076.1 hypothetical protein GCM10010387_50490 [Streptomyces inusitatus]